ncbi:MAG: alanine--tRNA ligase [Candidatus Berkelbacteria bacterium]
MTSKELRVKFLDFFKDNDHLVMPSASLVPEGDQSVLFNTAGMQQFKKFYTNPTEAPSARITTYQKCIRTGDIEEVGDDTHNTFFEMLGNFSFGYPSKEGSYFKAEAIKFAWQFLTEVLGVNKNRIHATYFVSEKNIPTDTESLEILKSISGLKEIKPQGFDDNFWSLGTENSPGGPTVEFYIDRVEVWNLVFNEYIYRAGQYEPAESKGVDTGMGFERLLMSLNGFDNVYEIDILKPIIDKIKNIAGAFHPFHGADFRVVADHMRAAVFLINEGVVPNNKDQGYIVRRLIRRAIVKLNSLGVKENVLKEIAQTIFSTYSGVYEFGITNVLSELEKEESRFRVTLAGGLKLLTSKNNLTGKDLFDLYQSFGLPLEVSLEEAKNHRIQVLPTAVSEYNELFKGHQELSRTASAGMFKGGLVGESEQTTKYHTATHLLLASLRQVLGEGVHQKGSNITDERMRFDFSYQEKMTEEQIKQVEDLVNQKIQEDLPVSMTEMRLEDAQACGAMGEFSSKYGEEVKVYKIGDFSTEMCGGPHVEHTGGLGHFKILKEESSSSGIRRIKAILE